jgi:hypothetical protein
MTAITNNNFRVKNGLEVTNGVSANSATIQTSLTFGDSSIQNSAFMGLATTATQLVNGSDILTLDGSTGYLSLNNTNNGNSLLIGDVYGGGIDIINVNTSSYYLELASGDYDNYIGVQTTYWGGNHGAYIWTWNLTNSVYNKWYFNTDGGLQYPDNTIQYTAYNGPISDQALYTTSSVVFSNVTATNVIQASQFRASVGASYTTGYSFYTEVDQSTGIYSETEGQVSIYGFETALATFNTSTAAFNVPIALANGVILSNTSTNLFDVYADELQLHAGGQSTYTFRLTPGNSQLNTNQFQIFDEGANTEQLNISNASATFTPPVVANAGLTIGNGSPGLTFGDSTVQTTAYTGPISNQLLYTTSSVTFGEIILQNTGGGTPKTVTAYGNAHISTAQYVYGTSSIALDGTTNTDVGIAESSDFAFGTGDFTVETWVYANSWSGYHTIWSSGNVSNVGNFAAYINGGNNLEIYNNGVGPALFTASFSALSTNTWYHFAIVRESGTMTFYINGSSVGSSAVSYNFTAIGSASYLASDGEGGYYFSGYVQDLRITRAAVYTGSFTPPTALLSPVSGTVLLISGQGANNSTTIVDSSVAPGYPGQIKFSDNTLQTTAYDGAIFAQGYLSGGNQAISSGTDQTLLFTGQIDPQSLINGSNQFVVPTTGTYEVSVCVLWAPSATNTDTGQINIQIHKNSDSVLILQNQINVIQPKTLSGSVFIATTATDTIHVTAYTDATTGQTIQASIGTIFTVKKIN